MQKDLLKDLLPKFSLDLEALGRSPSTILAYKADLEQLLVFLRERSKVLPDQVKEEDIEGFRDSLTTKKYTPKSVSRKLNAIKTFFRYLSDKKMVIADPSLRVSHPRIESSDPRFLSPIEYRALRDVARADVRVGTMIELILQTGLRISEVANLKTSDVAQDSIRIEAYATQPERTIPLNAPAKLAIHSYLAKRPKTDSPFVFVSKNGNSLAVRNIRVAVDRYMQKAELPKFSVNDLRTTFLVQNIRAGVDLVLLSQVSGHKRLSTTERYIKLAGVTESGKKQELQEL